MKAQRGSVVTEFAFTLPLLTLILLGLLTFGVALYAQMVVSRAAEDAARSVSFLSSATTYSDLAATTALQTCAGPLPRTAAQASVQCEALDSLASSAIIKGATYSARFATLRSGGVVVVVANGTCAADSNSLGVQVTVPLSLMQIVSPIASLSALQNLTGCAAVAL